MPDAVAAPPVVCVSVRFWLADGAGDDEDVCCGVGPKQGCPTRPSTVDAVGWPVVPSLGRLWTGPKGIDNVCGCGGGLNVLFEGLPAVLEGG